MAGLTILVTVLVYIVPSMGAKKFGASKYGFWGSIIGMILGIVYAPPPGMIIFAFTGAFIGELLSGRRALDAIKAVS